MVIKTVVNPNFGSIENILKDIIKNFNVYTQILGDAERNVIKVIDVNDLKVTIKSFKIPNLLNQIVYRYFRKSKAQRSFEYANRLTELKIGTPTPVLYQENKTWLGLRESYYVSLYADCDLTYRELTKDFTIPDHENILRAFTRFTHKLHKNGVNFLDHSPGNTLIKRLPDDQYDFFLVDLNRMEFGEMNFETRVKNFAKLTIHKEMIEVMSNEYAKCTGEDEQKIFKLMWQETQDFQNRYYRKKRWKKKILFWRKK